MARSPITRGPEPQYERVVSGYETFHHERPFRCDWGGRLPELDIAYETWGTLSADRDNAILLHTGLSASSHAHSHSSNPHRGWWEEFVGPGRPLDTERWFVICSNLLGGCYGSTGPASTDPATGEPWATDFPILTVRDMVRAQLLLLDHLRVERVHASIGASLGGMQSLMLAALEPDRLGRLVSISAAARSHPQSIAMRFVQRQAVMADPDWREGRYYGESFPHRGLRVAREIGTLTYRSGPEWGDRFARRRIKDDVPRLDEDFEVEGYLAYQGDKFCLQYDPNSYLFISKAMDLFDMTEEAVGQPGEPTRLSQIVCPALVIGVSSDILFPVWQQRELARLLELSATAVRYEEIDSPYGHDTFLIEHERVGGVLAEFLEG
ncbi:MAG TPA: homoserine O-acetyltransferase [Planctomycetota bacterium]|nr:homoserine O-acetyltransferase [Planctomycetota bacterium]